MLNLVTAIFSKTKSVIREFMLFFADVSLRKKLGGVIGLCPHFMSEAGKFDYFVENHSHNFQFKIHHKPNLAVKKGQDHDIKF